jgi:hypothetical protein
LRQPPAALAQAGSGALLIDVYQGEQGTMAYPITCTPKRLPRELLLQAAQKAREINQSTIHLLNA